MEVSKTGKLLPDGSKRLTEDINLEYEITRERLDKCQALIEPSASSLSRLEKSMSNLTEQVSTDRNDAEATRSIFKNEIVRIDQESYGPDSRRS